ncbi:MAG: hypothetical protein HFH68_03250 [Lachnospiraceae bacterium]|nr:hypothetical protein [Lachnospiraceae bacterium]
MGKIIMERIKFFISIIWFVCISIISPVWTGCIYMYITGHSKGYAYDLGSETDISIFLGIVFLILWLLAILPVTVSLCKKCYKKRKSLVLMPLLIFMVLFAAGVNIVSWKEFIKFFGYF